MARWFGILLLLFIGTLFSAGTIAALQTTGVVVFWEACTDRLYAMNPDGTGRQVLTNVGGFRPLDVSRGPSPVTALASGPTDPTNPYSPPTLFAIRPDGAGSPVRLLQPTDPVPGGYGVFSPDGHRVAYFHYESVTPPRAEVYIGDVVRDGMGNVTGLTNITFVVDLFTLGQRSDTVASGPFTGAVDFAPDGLRLMAVIYDDLWLLQLGPDARTLVSASPLTRTKEFAELHPGWSRTADVIAFSGGPYSEVGGFGFALSTSDMNIYTLDLGTLSIRQVTTNRNKGSSGAGKDHPNWSPDGSHLLYMAQGSSALGRRSSPCGNLVNYDLFQIRADGSEKAVNVTNTSGTAVEYFPRWGR